MPGFETEPMGTSEAAPAGRIEWLGAEEQLVLLLLERRATLLAECDGAPDPIGAAVADRSPGALRITLRTMTRNALPGAGLGPIVEVEREIAEQRTLLAAMEKARPTPTPWASLKARLGLHALDIELLRCLFVIGTSPVAARLAAALGGDPSRVELLQPGVGLDFLMAVLAQGAGDRTRFRHLADPDHPLVRYRLVQVRRDVAHWPRLRASDALVGWVLGGTVASDPALTMIARPAPQVPPRPLVPVGLWPRIEASIGDPGARLYCIAPTGAAIGTLVEGLAAASGKAVVNCRIEARTAIDVIGIAVRNAVLLDAWLHLNFVLDAEAAAAHPNGEKAALAALIAEAPIPIVIEATAQTGFGAQMARGFEQFEFSGLNPEELAALWVAASPGGARGPAGKAEALVTTVMQDHRLQPESVLKAAPDAVARAARAGRATLQRKDIVEACAAQAIADIGSLAVRQSGTFTWEDLIVPDETGDMLREILSASRNRTLVMDTWGFGVKYPYGSCLSALFSGPSGTGKTMAATLIADALERPLYRVDLSQIFDRFVGETEKNLSRIFDAAEAAHAVLLFDEADALFSKRTEVKSSNDRYANLEVNHLLQRIEHHRGVVILTTNLDSSIDEAFRRRIRFSVRFPMPDEGTRARLWESMIPRVAMVARDVDFVRLGRAYDLPGGGIKNAVLRGAYLAAGDNSPIAMTHLERAARAECMALGKLVRSV